MSFLVPLLATLAAVAGGWVALSHLVRMAFKRRGWALDWAGLTLPLFGGICVTGLTVAGFVRLLPGVILAVGLLGATAVLLADSWLKMRKLPDAKPARRILAALRSQAQGGLEYIREDVADVVGLFRREPKPDDGRQADAPQPTMPVDVRPRRDVSVPRTAEAAAAGVPPVREDPRLPDVGPPDHIAGNLAAAGVGVPPAWAALAEMIATFEPDTEEDLSASLAGDAAGVLALSEAYRARADNLLHAVGLDPSCVAGHVNVADEISGLSQAFSLIHHQYQVFYGALSEAVQGGLILPHKARQWFGGGGTPQPAEGTEDEAAA
jgi:hypothetical protein